MRLTKRKNAADELLQSGRHLRERWKQLLQLNEGKIVPSSGWTSIFIYPGYEFSIVDGLLTNFHLPKSTLLMLISALVNTGTYSRCL